MKWVTARFYNLVVFQNVFIISVLPWDKIGVCVRNAKELEPLAALADQDFEFTLHGKKHSFAAFSSVILGF